MRDILLIIEDALRIVAAAATIVIIGCGIYVAGALFLKYIFYTLDLFYK